MRESLQFEILCVCSLVKHSMGSDWLAKNLGSESGSRIKSVGRASRQTPIKVAWLSDSSGPLFYAHLQRVCFTKLLVLVVQLLREGAPAQKMF